MLGKSGVPCVLFALVALVCELGKVPEARGEEFTLTSQRQLGEISQVEVLLEVGGELAVKDETEKKVHDLKTSVVGTMVYDEKLISSASEAARSIRNYRRCDAVIKIDKGATKTRLREDRRLVAVAADQRQADLFCPVAPLSQEELDLIELPACSLLVERLLPDRPVSPGDQWQHSEDLLIALLNLDAVSQCEVTTTFKEVTGGAAQLELAGTVHGALDGVSTEIELKGRYKFDLKQGRITWFALLVKEKRPIGPVAPGVDVSARLQMKIVPGSDHPALADAALADLQLDPAPEAMLLEFTCTEGRFQFLHDRAWHVVSDNGKSVTLRLMDRGELIAQCNASALATVEPGKRFTLAKFQEDVKSSLDKHFQRFDSAGESENSAGHMTCRVIAAGAVEGLPIQWNYFLVADNEGHQAVFAFTVETELVERFATADKSILATLRFLPSAADTAAQPAKAPQRK